MEKKDIRVLALDLDGTLTNDQRSSPPPPAQRWMQLLPKV